MISQAADIRQEIERADQAFCAAFNRGDAAGVASCYAEGGQLLPAHSEIVERPAIRTFWQGVMNLGIQSAELRAVEVEACGDYAHEVGAYALRLADGTPADRGKYVVIWKREQGEWKLYRDIWTTSLSAG
jgi:ketosteroid isomerase-like protein